MSKFSDEFKSIDQLKIEELEAELVDCYKLIAKLQKRELKHFVKPPYLQEQAGLNI